MTNYADLFKAISSGLSFPAAIPLPPVKRPPRSGTKLFNEIRSGDDLPSRFLTGELATFNSSTDGWTATFADEILPSEVIVSANERTITIQESIGGQCTIHLFYPARGSWKDLAQPISTTTPGALIRALGSTLSGRFNVHLVPWEEVWPSVATIPDGFMFDLYLPVPVAKLMDLFQLHRRLAQENILPCTLSGQLRFHGSVVSFLEGKNGPEFEKVAELDVRNIFELGTPFFQQAQREVAPGGSAAWTLRRTHYVYHAFSHYRCLPYLLRELLKGGLIGAAPGSSWEEGFPHAPEYEAWVIPSPLMNFGWDNLARNVGENRRRLTLLPWEPEVALEASTGWISETHSKGLITDAEIASKKYLE